MADFKISELTNHTPASSDDMIINDNSTPSSPETKRTTVASLATIIGSLIGDTGGGENPGGGNNSFFDPIYFYDTSVKSASVPSGSGGIRNWHSMKKENIGMPEGANAAIMIHFMGSTFQPTATGSGSYRLYGDLETKLTGGTFLAGSTSAPSTIMGRVITHNVPVPGGTANLSRKSSTPNTKIDIITFAAEASLTFEIAFNISNQAPSNLTVGLGRVILIPFFSPDPTPVAAEINDGSGFYATDQDEYDQLVSQFLPLDTDADIAEDDGDYIRSDIFEILSLIESFTASYPAINASEIATEKEKLMLILTGAQTYSSVEETRGAVIGIRNAVYSYTITRFAFETAAGVSPF